MLECAGSKNTRDIPAERMRHASTVTAIGLVLWLTAPSAHALGFGRISNATQLGQRLNFAAEVRLGSDETLARECVSAEVLVGDNRLQLNQVRVTLEPGTDPNERSVRVTSTALIDEPVVTVSITLGCGARITHRFVAFIDPPMINMAQTAAADSTPLPAQRLDSQVAPLVDIVQGSDAPAARRTLARPPRPRAVTGPSAGSSAGSRAAAGTPVSDANAGERRPGRSSRMAAAPRPSGGGPRLRLEAAPLLVGRPAPETPAPQVEAMVTSALAAAAASAASAADEAGQKLAKERERIQALEDSMKRLRDDSQATQKALGALQARLNQAESERYANPLVYGLAWLSALLAVAVAAMWWRQSRQRGNPQWWNSPAAAAAAEAAEARHSRNSLLREQISAPQVFATGPDVAGALNSATIIEPPRRPAPSPASVTAPLHPEPARELSVEELIDLEQQAEFFIVLGQDEAAIELLMSHVRSDGGISPLPYLKLLEIYRRRGEVESYQRIRERFNRRFNAYAPDWDSDLQQGRSLEDYPGVTQQLQSLWSGPERTMECLDGLLFRRKQNDQTFDLPAYRELLFLYSIARDLAEQEASRPGADVDLLLPIGEPDHDGPISQLMTTTSALDMRPSPQSTQPLNLGVTYTSEPEPKRFSSESGFINLNDLDLPSSKSGKR
jgi:pilus assembly protein FimV